MIERILLLFNKYPLDFISDFSSILPIIIGVVNYSYLKNSLKGILLFFCMYLVGDAYMTWLGLIRENNLFILNLYPIFGIFLLSFSYINTFRPPRVKRFIRIIALVLTFLCALLFKSNEVSSAASFIYKIYTVSLMLLYFNEIIADMRIKYILKYSLFWISSGIIIYAAGTFFISLFSGFIFDPALVDDATFDAYWNLNNILFIILCLFASVGMWCSQYDLENTM